MNWLVNYFQEARAELTKVTWPTRKQATQLSIAVIVFAIAFAIFVGLLDALFTQALQKLILKV